MNSPREKLLDTVIIDNVTYNLYAVVNGMELRDTNNNVCLTRRCWNIKAGTTDGVRWFLAAQNNSVIQQHETYDEVLEAASSNNVLWLKIIDGLLVIGRE